MQKAVREAIQRHRDAMKCWLREEWALRYRQALFVLADPDIEQFPDARQEALKIIAECKARGVGVDG